MRLYIVLLLIGFLSSPVLSDSSFEKIAIETDPGSGSQVIFSDIPCNMSTTWNIPNENVTGETSKFVKSLVISNLALENGSSLMLNSSANNGNAFTITGEGTASLPILYLDINVTHFLNYTRTAVCSNYSRTLLQASWTTVTNDACAPIEVTGKQSFKSYNYPNNYPLQEYDANSQCRNVSSPAASIYVTFLDLDLAEGHRLEFADKTRPFNLTASNLPGDAIVSSKTVINFSRSFNPQKKTIKDINDKLSGRGFNIDLEALECGGEVERTDAQKFPLNGTEKQKCIWIIRTPNKDLNTLKVLNFSLSDGLDNVIIHDSDSRKNNLLVNRTGAEYVNSTSETIIIEYTSTNTTAYLNWSTMNCLDKCLNARRCINPSQRCNGINDCGDWSDELHCNGSIPIPPPKTEPASGVPGLVVVFVIIPIALILGILGTIFVPRLVARIRERRYQEFREYSDVS